LDATLVIPALNEEESLGAVLSAVNADQLREIILVDGGSTDRTVDIAEAHGALVIQEPRPGYGHACAAGANHAQGEIIIFMDADGADDPLQIPNLIKPIQDGEADLVLGSRLAGKIYPGAMPWHQKLGNQFSANMIHFLYGLPLTDLSPFRAILRSRLMELNLKEMTYGWPTEMVAKSARKGYRIVEIPVDYHPRIGGQSKISGTMRGTFLATYHILHTILKYSFAAGV
jgi:glycosyltransferase involved in cell wall biosynthesis